MESAMGRKSVIRFTIPFCIAIVLILVGYVPFFRHADRPTILWYAAGAALIGLLFGSWIDGKRGL
jgi:hypothetical protein